MPTQYFETGSTRPTYNLAFEETVLRRRTMGDCLILWQNDNAVIVGRNQNAEAEINRAFVEEHGITLVRRMTGGGAVYHDLGNLNYSFITDAGDAAMMNMQRFTAPVVRALCALGLQAEASGRNDILVEGRKVSGTAQRLLNGRILHHGTLLFDANPGMVAGALRADPEKFKSKSAKSVRARIGNIRDFLQEDMTMAEFWEYLKTALSGEGFEAAELTAEELREAETLEREKYATWAWNFEKSPAYELYSKRRFAGGGLEVHAAVKEGRITGIAFRGDFLSVTSPEPLQEALCGCRFRREDLAAVLAQHPIGQMFGGITEAEIVDTILAVE